MGEKQSDFLKRAVLVVGLLGGLTALGFTMPWNAITELQAKEMVSGEVEPLQQSLKRIEKKLDKIEDCLRSRRCGR